jgi:hypothetical protein
MSPGGPRDQKIDVQYCTPKHWAKRQPHNIDAITEGASYNKNYADWPQNIGKTGSYVDATLKAGRATVNYARVGTVGNRSSHPLSTEVTVDRDAYVLHQVVQSMRKRGFKVVNSIVHSYSGAVGALEAARYQDVSRLGETGFLHDDRNPAIPARIHSITEDNMFKDSGLDAGYLTTIDGTRDDSFHDPSVSDLVVRRDEKDKDVISKTAFLGYVTQQQTPAFDNISRLIKAPVFAEWGVNDAIFCRTNLNCADKAAVLKFEAPYYTGAQSLDGAIIWGSGHDIAIDATDAAAAAVTNWIARTPPLSVH